MKPDKEPQQKLYTRKEVMQLLAGIMKMSINRAGDSWVMKRQVDSNTNRVQMDCIQVGIEAAKVYLDHYEVLELDEIDALKNDLKEFAEVCVEVHRETFPTEDKA